MSDENKKMEESPISTEISASQLSISTHHATHIKVTDALYVKSKQDLELERKKREAEEEEEEGRDYRTKPHIHGHYFYDYPFSSPEVFPQTEEEAVKMFQEEFDFPPDDYPIERWTWLMRGYKNWVNDELAYLRKHVDINQPDVTTVKNALLKLKKDIEDILAKLEEYDTAIKDLQDDVDRIDGEISDINTTLTDHEDRLTQAETDIDAVEACCASATERLNEHDTTLADHETRISTNTTDIVTNSAAIEKNKEDIATNTDEITTIKSRLDADEQAIETINSQITTINEHLAEIDTTLTDHDARITANEELSEENATAINSDILPRLTTAETNIENNTLAITENAGKIASNESAIAVINTTLENYSERLITAETAIADTTVSITTISTNLTALDTRVSDNTTHLQTVDSSLTSINAGIGDLSQRLGELTELTGTASELVQEYDSRITANKNAIDANKTNIANHILDYNAALNRIRKNENDISQILAGITEPDAPGTVTSVASLATRIKNAEDNIITANSSISTLNSDVSTLKTDVSNKVSKSGDIMTGTLETPKVLNVVDVPKPDKANTDTAGTGPDYWEPSYISFMEKVKYAYTIKPNQHLVAKIIVGAVSKNDGVADSNAPAAYRLKEYSNYGTSIWHELGKDNSIAIIRNENPRTHNINGIQITCNEDASVHYPYYISGINGNWVSEPLAFQSWVNDNFPKKSVLANYVLSSDLNSNIYNYINNSSNLGTLRFEQGRIYIKDLIFDNVTKGSLSNFSNLIGFLCPEITADTNNFYHGGTATDAIFSKDRAGIVFTSRNENPPIWLGAISCRFSKISTDYSRYYHSILMTSQNYISSVIKWAYIHYGVYNNGDIFVDIHPAATYSRMDESPYGAATTETIDTFMADAFAGTRPNIPYKRYKKEIVADSKIVKEVKEGKEIEKTIQETRDVQVELTQEELAARLRRERNIKLMSYNGRIARLERVARYTRTREGLVEIENEVLAWDRYAEALCDLPDQPGFPWDGGGPETPWPEKPSVGTYRISI